MQNSNDEDDDDFVNGYLRKQHEQTFSPPQFTSNSQALTGFPQMPKIKHPLNTESLNFSNTIENKYMTAYAEGFSPNSSINQPSQPSSTTSQNRSHSATEKEKNLPKTLKDLSPLNTDEQSYIQLYLIKMNNCFFLPNLFYLHKLLIANRATTALFTVSLDMHLENRAFLLTGAPIPRRNLAS